MSVILIQDASGDSSIRELSKQFPVAVGRHSSNDIQVLEPGVEVLHCRISWNSRAYEVISGAPGGVDVNGDLVPSAILTPGDCIQVASIGIFYYDNSEQLEAALRGESIEEVETDEPEVYSARQVERRSEHHPEVERKQRRQEPSVKSPTSRAKRQKTPPPVEVRPEPAVKPSSVKSTVKAVAKPEIQEAIPEELDEEFPPIEESRPEKNIRNDAQSVGLFGTKPVRPGEQDPLRSPFVLTLGIGTIVLVMVSLALWFVIGRDSSNKAYQLAVEEMTEKRFTQAIAQFDEFLKNYPGHQFASAARHAMGQSLVEQPLAGAIPDWKRGLENLNQYVDQRRRDKDFPEMAPIVADLAKRIALGAAASAGIEKQPELLNISSDATRLLQSYSSIESPPKQDLLEIDAAVHKAELLIRQHDTFQTALVQIDRELKEQHPFAAFEVRRKLLLKYPTLDSDKSLQSRVKQMLEVERKLTSRVVFDQAALTSEAELPAESMLKGTPPLVLLRHTRTRLDTLASGISVFTIVYDTLVAADSATGMIQWRRVIGLDPPFAPLPVSLDVLSLLLFDGRRNELILIRQRDGGLIWRQPMSQPVTAAPLIHAGQIFVPIRGGKLCQLDLVSGKLLAILTFSQPLAASPVLSSSSERLVVAGDRAVLYSLNYRPLECVAVTYSEHASGSVQAPLLKMGDFLLTAENDRQDSAKLRVWDLSVGDQPLKPLAQSRIQGQVHEPSTIRGKQLVVPSSPERLSAFTVSDEKNDKALTPAGTYQVESPRGSPISVTLGPNDEMWMTGSSLRRFVIGPDSLTPDKGQMSLGVSTQPVQVLDQTLFATSRVPSNSAISFLAADRRELVSHWQLVMGGRAVAAGSATANDGSIPFLLDTGDIFSISSAKLQAGGQDARPITTLPIPTGSKTPLHGTVLSNGRLVAWSDGTPPLLWQLNADGVVARESKLPANLEASPILLSGGILLPLPGKLRLIEASGFNAAVEDLMPPVDPKLPSRWRGVLPLDDKQFVAVNDQGRILRGQVRTEPVPHVAEVSSLELKQRVEQTPVVVGSTLFVVADKKLRGFDTGTFEPRGEVALVDVVSQGPWVVDTAHLAMVCGRDQLVVISIGNPLGVKWSQKLTSGSLAGAPLLRKGEFVIASHSGQIALRKQEQGDLSKVLELGQTLTLGPCLVKEQVFVATQDGSLRLLDSWLEAQP